jgi:hypothetical protein
VTAGKGTVQQHAVAQTATEEGGEPAPSPVPSPQPEGIDPKILAIGGVALVGVAFGAYVLLKK